LGGGKLGGRVIKGKSSPIRRHLWGKICMQLSPKQGGKILNHYPGSLGRELKQIICGEHKQSRGGGKGVWKKTDVGIGRPSLRRKKN